MLQNGKEKCTCKRKECPRHSKCEECVQYHLTESKYKRPYCMRRKKINREGPVKINGEDG